MREVAIAITSESATRVGPAPRGMPVAYAAAAVVGAAALALAVLMSRQDGTLAALWFAGLLGGVILQRSRFCFTSAFRDLFLFGSARMMKAIILGLAIATVGFAAIMHTAVPFPGSGVLPAQAHVLPAGASTVLAGLLFGYGMVIAGGCVSGSLYRAAEGYVASWVSLGGIVVGLGVIAETWNWWWTSLISSEPVLWLPDLPLLGYAGSIALTLALLVALYLVVEWWEARSGVVAPRPPAPGAEADSFRRRIASSWTTVFRHGWPAPVGGAALGGLTVLMYAIATPFGVTGELGRWAGAALDVLRLTPPPALGLSGLAGCGTQGGEGVFANTFSVTVGVLAGALVAALLAKEFKVRFPRSAIRYIQSLGGGVLMGLGAGLALGCTVGAFFSAIPSLSVAGWLFGASLGGGAYLGVKTIERIP